ncbi:MAG: hypothetical protein ACOH5I_24210 [Oligoflexus sp.]
MRATKFLLTLLMCINLISCKSNKMMSKQSSDEDATTDQTLVGEKNSEEDVIASEPVTVTGGYLACQYLPDQQQNTDPIMLECQLANLPDLHPDRIEANFYKTNAEGNAYPLQIQSQNIQDLTWTIAESPETLGFTNLVAEISFDGSEAFSFTTTVEFNSSSEQKLELFLASSQVGLVGGHFDIDTSTQIYAPFAGDTDGHVHEYDDKYQLNGADFLNLQDSKLNNIQDIIAPGQLFSLVLLNAPLSALARLGINDSSILVTDYNRANISKTVYSLGEQVPGTVTLEKLLIAWPLDAMARNGLVASAPSCVRANQISANGEYRNGALVLQAVDPSRYAADPVTGWTTAGLLWEASLYWHRDANCQ